MKEKENEKTKEKERTSACEKCPKMFADEAYLKAHVRIAHKNDQEVPVETVEKRAKRKTVSELETEPESQEDEVNLR